MGKFLISCGGSGGHVTPGIAVAQGLIDRGHQVNIIISKKSVDTRLVQKYSQFKFLNFHGSHFSIKPIKLIKFIITQIANFFQSIWYLFKIKPDVVIGFGGFNSFGTILAALAFGYSCVLHEANRKPGKVVRLLSGFVKRVYLSEGVHLKSLPPDTIRHFGYPIRKEIKIVSKEIARRMLGLPKEGKVLLVIGGSQGAQILNDWVTKNCSWFGANAINVYCILGPGKGVNGVIEQSNSSGQKTCVIFTPFADNMSLVLSAADLAIARAGAGTIAEFIHCKLPSILIPFPYSADDHQNENALIFEKQGGGIVINQKDIKNLKKEVESTIFNDWLLSNFRKNLTMLSRFNSLDAIVKDLEELV